MKPPRALAYWLAALALASATVAGIRAGAAEALVPGTESDEPVDPPIESLPPSEQPLPTMPAPKPEPTVAAPWQPRAIAELSALDKVDDRSATLNIPVGQMMQFQHLSIAVRACVVWPPDRAPNAAAFLQIADARAGSVGFSGWMLAAQPSASMLHDPVYDVRVVACH